MNIEALVEERRLARERGDFERADEIRALLDAGGVVLRDRRDGTTRAYWKGIASACILTSRVSNPRKEA